MGKSLQIGSQLGAYKVLAQLGQGGAGVVYRAKNVTDGTECALKTLTAGTVEVEAIHKRFVREISVAQKLKHENIVGYYDCGLHEDVLYFTMELVTMGTLAEVLSRQKTLDWRDAVECGSHICRALAYLHEHQLVHRDLKPANIFLSDDGELKVGDFGLTLDPTMSRLTIDGEAVGTAKYLSPEQAMALADIDGRSDLYALGCLLFEMLCGRTPFVADSSDRMGNYVQLMRQHVEVTPPLASDFRVGLPPALVELINRLLGKKPAERPQSALEVEQALASILTDPSVELPAQKFESLPDPLPQETNSNPRQSLTERLHQTNPESRQVNKIALVVVAIVVVLILGGIALFNR